MLITEQEHLEWLNHPVTKEVLQVLRNHKDRIAHSIASGECEDINEVNVCVGRYSEIDEIINLTYEGMRGENDK